MSGDLAENLAGRIGTRGEAAFVRHGDVVFYTHRLKRAPPEPSSAIVELVRAIHARFPGEWRRILRNRIFATARATEMCHGTVAVGAKRLTEGVVPRDHGPLPEGLRLEAVAFPSAPKAALPEAPAAGDPMALARRLASAIPRVGPLDRLDRPVGAVLAGPGGDILAWGVNAGARNRTLHAEAVMIADYFARTGQGIPTEAAIYSTLKPCKMCAGILWEAAEDPASLRVYYAEMDEGPKARLTVLDPRTHERRRAIGNTALLDRELEWLSPRRGV